MNGHPILWIFFALPLLLLGFSAYIVSKHKAYKSYGIIAVIFSLITTFLATSDCYLNSASEACVWRQSFMLLYLGFLVLLMASTVFLIRFYGKKLRLDHFKCPNCANLISNSFIRSEVSKQGFGRPWFVKLLKCNHCEIGLKLNIFYWFFIITFLGSALTWAFVDSTVPRDISLTSMIIAAILMRTGLCFNVQERT